MTATEEKREVGFPWFERHAVRGGKEIFQYTLGEIAACPSYPKPFIKGARWTDSEAIHAFYAAAKNADRFISPYEYNTFLGYEPDALDAGFSSWEEAVNWLFAKDGAA